MRDDGVGRYKTRSSHFEVKKGDVITLTAPVRVTPALVTSLAPIAPPGYAVIAFTHLYTYDLDL